MHRSGRPRSAERRRSLYDQIVRENVETKLSSSRTTPPVVVAPTDALGVQPAEDRRDPCDMARAAGAALRWAVTP
jgi:hypothetical protein